MGIVNLNPYKTKDMKYVFYRTIKDVNQKEWASLQKNASIFLDVGYLKVLENINDEMRHLYVIVYQYDSPIMIISVQMMKISAYQLNRSAKGLKKKILSMHAQNVLVCGNLFSGGLHGFACKEEIDTSTQWGILAEVIEAIVTKEHNTKIQSIVLKDFCEKTSHHAHALKPLKYWEIKTEPKMVLTIPNEVHSFEDYLQCLNARYRSSIKKVHRKIEQAGYSCMPMVIDDEMEKEIYPLYEAVENRSTVDVASVPFGYLRQVSLTLKDNFQCYVIKDKESIKGFITIIKDGNVAVSHLVGIEYTNPLYHMVYLRLLHLVIEFAIEQDCSTIDFGRTALEAKANLGAKTSYSYVWAKHHSFIGNSVLKKLFRHISFDDIVDKHVYKKI